MPLVLFLGHCGCSAVCWIADRFISFAAIVVTVAYDQAFTSLRDGRPLWLRMTNEAGGTIKFTVGTDETNQFEAKNSKLAADVKA